jgi:hypothetical protein
METNDHLIGFNATAKTAPVGADRFFGVITCTWQDSGREYIAVRDLDGAEERTYLLEDVEVSG